MVSVEEKLTGLSIPGKICQYATFLEQEINNHSKNFSEEIIVKSLKTALDKLYEVFPQCKPKDYSREK